MTNTNESIWHTKDEVPEIGREILCIRENKWADGWGKKYTVRNSKHKIPFNYDAYITKWAYLDNLLIQSQQSESLKAENKRLKQLLIECQNEIRVLHENIGNNQYNGLNKEKSELELKLVAALAQPKE